MEDFFSSFRNSIIGYRQSFHTPYGEKEMIYADWTASGRAYRPIEEYLQKEIMPFIGNTHTKTTITGTLMSDAYEKARRVIKQHVNANDDDALIFCGSGTTHAVNKLQRMLGLRMPERLEDYLKEDTLEIHEALRPIVFITHMEHHSNQVSWLETIADLEIFDDTEHLHSLLQHYRNRKNKIAAITACSNVTGIQVPIHQIAKMIHQSGGLCFVDFAGSAPYVKIDMHPEDKAEHLDAIYFSPHKFLGGPGSAGVLILNKKIYNNRIPDQPGGGTVMYSNPWKYHEYVESIEEREDGGTPPFLQGIKAAMCICLKDEMGVERMLAREEEILTRVFRRLAGIKNIEILEGKTTNRLGIISFIVKGAHHHLVVKILNDRFGIQLRGGCSCAGTYGHRLLNVDKKKSYEILDALRAGDKLSKPGWIRLSIHPVMSNGEIDFIMDAIELTVLNSQSWSNCYGYDDNSGEYFFKSGAYQKSRVEDWYCVANW